VVAACKSRWAPRSLSHMEWNEVTDRFEKVSPKASPLVEVEASLMSDVHQEFGVSCKPTFPTITINAIADTGCQTTTAGVNVLKKLNISRDMLIPTRHKIVGITENSLEIIGVVMLNLKHAGRTTRQMVYISTQPGGLYLSETALIALGLIHENFPKHDISVCSAGVKVDDDVCNCHQRIAAPERPDRIPFEPTKQNLPKLKAWLLDRFSSSGFNKCPHQELNSMTGAPMEIHFKEDAEPYAVHTPIPVPMYWKYNVKEDIERDVRLGIIEKVPQGTPVKWCSRMVVVGKPDLTPRRVVDLQQLKKATLRETHYTNTPFEIVSQTPNNTVKTVLDAWNGYHSLMLADASKDATTFITEWGRYRYKRAPMGHHSSGDAYTRRFDDITADFERVKRCVDDSLLWDRDIEAAFWHTYDYIKLCADNGIIFNPEKFVFAEEVCEFAGFEITMDGYRPNKKIIEAIQSFSTPKTITDMRSWFGLVNQVAYAFVQSNQMAPFRELLKKNNAKFYWDDTLEKVFQESKRKIVELIREGVKTFDPSRVTCVATDYSKVGFGYTLTQKKCKCPKPYTPICGKGHWDLIIAGSRFATETESRYAPIEGEALAAAYALNQCKHFVLGCPELILATDHKPLTKILNDRELEGIENPRLLRIKEKTLRFDFEVVHVAGKDNHAPDAFSRHPRKLDQEELKWDADEEATSRVFAIQQSTTLPASISWDMVNAEATSDFECVGLKAVVEQGFPQNKNQLPEHLKYFWSMRDELYMIEHVPFKGRKMLIPNSLRKRVLEGLHSGHQGVSSMASNARERLFWPRLDADLRQVRDQCRKCNEIAPSLPAETLVMTPDPEMPFEQVATDFFEIGSHPYLVYADRYSAWTDAKKLKDKTGKSVKKGLLDWFKTFGVPNEISTDSGPPFESAEYNEFLKTWDITKRVSSAYYPQSNGRAEVAVKTMKRILLGNVDPRTGEVDNTAATRAILAHRNTPTQQSKLSPSEMVFGHKMRDHLPNKNRKLLKRWSDARLCRERRSAVPANRTRVHQDLAVGDHVSVQNQHGNKPTRWSNTGKVVEVLPFRKYRIMLDGSRRVTARNRRFLRKVPAVAADREDPPRRPVVGSQEVRFLTRDQAPLACSQNERLQPHCPNSTEQNTRRVSTSPRSEKVIPFPVTPVGRTMHPRVTLRSPPRSDLPPDAPRTAASPKASVQCELSTAVPSAPLGRLPPPPVLSPSNVPPTVPAAVPKQRQCALLPNAVVTPSLVPSPQAPPANVLPRARPAVPREQRQCAVTPRVSSPRAAPPETSRRSTRIRSKPKRLIEE